MSNPNWFGGSSPNERRPAIAEQSEATRRACEELEMITSWEHFVEVCRQQDERRKKGLRW